MWRTGVQFIMLAELSCHACIGQTSLYTFLCMVSTHMYSDLLTDLQNILCFEMKLSAILVAVSTKRCCDGNELPVQSNFLHFCVCLVYRRPVLLCGQQQDMRQLTIMMSNAMKFSHVMAMM